MNMKIFKSLFFLIFSFTLASCTKNHDTNFYERLKSAVEAGNEKKMENKNQEMLDYFFSFQDIYEKIRLSPKTPITIINYFKNLSDVEQIKYWLCIGAQNGSKECMKEYADLLRKSSNKNDNIRAGFWERKAK